VTPTSPFIPRSDNQLTLDSYFGNKNSLTFPTLPNHTTIGLFPPKYSHTPKLSRPHRNGTASPPATSAIV
jgi:hypothetical protein